MANTTLERPAQEAAGDERQIVALELAGEIYGADIAHVHTVLPLPPVTPVPRTPPHVAGVINLRGRILPVIDLRIRFGLPPLPEEQRRHARVVVVETDGLGAGLIVDGVSTVLRLPVGSVTPPSSLVASEETECITGIGRVPGGRRDGDTEGERLILLLDVRKALSSSPAEAAALRALERAAE